MFHVTSHWAACRLLVCTHEDPQPAKGGVKKPTTMSHAAKPRMSPRRPTRATTTQGRTPPVTIASACSIGMAGGAFRSEMRVPATGGALRTAAAEATVAPLADIAEAAVGASSSEMAAHISGMGMAVGSILLFSPIIVNILRHKSGEGISLTTFWMQLIGFSVIFLYNQSKGFPIAAYGENISLAVQSLVILVLAAVYQKAVSAPFIAGLVAYFAGVAACLAGLVGANVMMAMQVVATAVITGAIVPQILLNHKRKDTGEWSILTACASTSGNATRIFTTMHLTKDPLLMTGYILGFAVNALLLWQIIYYNYLRRGGNAAPV